MESRRVGAEHQCITGESVIKRFYAEPVANQMQALVPAIPKREGEHPVEAGQGRFKPPAFDGRQDHFGVRVAAKHVALFLKLGAQFPEVVDLAVEGQNITARGRLHGLAAIRRQVDDRQPAETETQAGLRHYHRPLLVGPPMIQHPGHFPEDVIRVRQGPFAVPESGESAHVRPPSLTRVQPNYPFGRFRAGSACPPPQTPRRPRQAWPRPPRTFHGEE